MGGIQEEVGLSGVIFPFGRPSRTAEGPSPTA